MDDSVLVSKKTKTKKGRDKSVFISKDKRMGELKIVSTGSLFLQNIQCKIFNSPNALDKLTILD